VVKGQNVSIPAGATFTVVQSSAKNNQDDGDLEVAAREARALAYENGGIVFNDGKPILRKTWKNQTIPRIIVNWAPVVTPIPTPIVAPVVPPNVRSAEVIFKGYEMTAGGVIWRVVKGQNVSIPAGATFTVVQSSMKAKQVTGNLEAAVAQTRILAAKFDGMPFHQGEPILRKTWKNQTIPRIIVNW
jgi:hypothetical protein